MEYGHVDVEKSLILCGLYARHIYFKSRNNAAIAIDARCEPQETRIFVPTGIQDYIDDMIAAERIRASQGGWGGGI